MNLIGGRIGAEILDVGLASLFGSLTTAHLTLPSVQGQPNVLALHASEGGRPHSWHTDGDVPAYPAEGDHPAQLEIPPYGGDTLLCDTTSAYLDRALRDQRQIASRGTEPVHRWFRL